ncbi:MAG: cardiolipin synthase ClsB [Betaproteobacteria bacterium]|nr:cardiolipin synthase ClsB [Betaproteobacteria bacterium]
MKPPKIVGGNALHLLKNGAEFFPALLAAIESAQADVRIETYIFRDDTTGKQIAAALAAAAARGVAVRLLVDGYGSRATPKVFFEKMRKAGVKVLLFDPDPHVASFNKEHLWRVHRKIALVDGRVGFIGGINLLDDLTESLSDQPRYDYAVQIEGPLLEEIYPSVHRLWSWVAWQTFRRKAVGAAPAHPKPAKAGAVRAAFVQRDNIRHRRDIERAYRLAIGASHHEILMVCAYFLPGRRMRHALLAAAKRGVKVTLLMQGRADHPLLQLATRALFTQLLGAGIIIHEYQRSMLHGKVAVIDGHWATVGSSNLDPFSLFLNREANVIVYDAHFAKQLRASVLEEIRLGSTPCAAADWQKRSWWQRVQTWCAYGFARLLSGWLGFAREWS